MSSLAAQKKGGTNPPFPALCVMSLLCVLALLVGHGARGLTGGLARGLALAAAAVGGTLLQGRAVERLDVSHSYLLQFKGLFIIPQPLTEFNTIIFSTFPVTYRCPGA